MSLNFLRRARGAGTPGAEDDSSGSKARDQTAYERRRQQVRRAQRNHRERKQNYIKALEQEVVNLRKQNQQNIREYEDEVSMLHRVFLSHGLSPPARQARIINVAEDDSDVYHPSSYTVSKPPGVGNALNLHIPPGMGLDLSQSIAAASDDSAKAAAEGSPGGSSRASAGRGGGLSPPATGGPSAPGVLPASIFTQGLAPATIDKLYGIGFVLQLEHPCMHHPEVTRDEFGTHSHMASHNLLAYAPADLTHAAQWEVPGADIDRLLALSTSFQLQGEITPVQAWYRLKQHPKFALLGEPQLERLRQLLAHDVKCYGFGSVMDEQIWLIAVEEVLSQL